MSTVKSRRRGRAEPVAAPHVHLNTLYWLIPLLLTSVQAWVSIVSLHQIRYEEVAESVRNVFWLDRRLIYDGISSNVGWYGTLLLVYKVFGFSLATAKYVRIGLHLLSLYCVASLLRRAMGPRLAVVPLLVIGLSPTRLYLDALQTSYGLDLSYGAICLWLLLSIRPAVRTIAELGKTCLCGIVAMVAAMSYPTFLCYLPSLIVVAAWWWRRADEAGMERSQRSTTWHALSGVVGFLLPLAIAYGFVRTRQLLIYDPETQAGLFRGGGAAGVSAPLVLQSMTTLLKDLFVRGQSYYFELTQPDFSGWLAMTAACGIAAVALYFAVTRKTNRALASATVLLLAASVLLPGLSTDGSPGLRRSTGVLAGYFISFAWLWRVCADTRSGSTLVRRAGMALCVTGLLASVLKLPSLLDDAAADSHYRNSDWFAVKESPAKSLEFLASGLVSGQRLTCAMDAAGNLVPCRYQEIYPAIAGYREWNGGAPIDVRAMDWRTGHEITLTPSLWSDHYYPTCGRLEACR